MKTLILEPNDYSENSLEIYHKLGDVEYEVSTNPMLVDILVVRLKQQLNEELLSQYSNLKFIVSPTTGLNHIDQGYCKLNGISIISLKNEAEFLSTITPTSELAWSLILSLTRNVIPAIGSVRLGNWNRELFIGRELYGQTLGVIGFGRLGKQVIEYAKAFKMNVLVYENDPKVTKCAVEDGFEFSPSLNSLLKVADIVTLHIDYKEENKGIFSHKEFSLMKNSAFFINTSRGELVNENDLLIALQTGLIKGAAIDVIDGEQVAKLSGHPLLRYCASHDNLLITPHIGGASSSAMRATEDFCANKLQLEISCESK